MGNPDACYALWAACGEQEMSLLYTVTQLKAEFVKGQELPTIRKSCELRIRAHSVCIPAHFQEIGKGRLYSTYSEYHEEVNGERYSYARMASIRIDPTSGDA